MKKIILDTKKTALVMCIAFFSVAYMNSHCSAQVKNLEMTLSVEKDVPGLKVRTGSAVSLVDHNERHLPVNILPQPTERRVPTENPRLVAFQKFDAKGGCQLRLVAVSGGSPTTINCNSQLILIPRNMDIVWIAGKTQHDGMFEESKSSTLAGLHLYGSDGRQLGELSALQTGIISTLKVLDDGTLYVLGTIDGVSNITKVSASGHVLAQIPFAIGVDDFRVFNEGQYVSVKAIQWKMNQQTAILLDQGGKVISKFSDSFEVAPEIISVTKDGAHVLVAKNLRRPGQRLVEVYGIKQTSNPVMKVKVDYYPNEILTNNSLSVFVVRRFKGLAGNHENHLFQILDSSGSILSQYECAATKNDVHSSWGADQKHVEWNCGDKHLELGIK